MVKLCGAEAIMKFYAPYIRFGIGFEYGTFIDFSGGVENHVGNTISHRCIFVTGRPRTYKKDKISSVFRQQLLC